MTKTVDKNLWCSKVRKQNLIIKTNHIFVGEVRRPNLITKLVDIFCEVKKESKT